MDMNFYSVLYNDNKLFNHKNELEKNISEPLLTVRTLVIIATINNEMEELNLLGNMLKACKLDTHEYHVVRENTSSWLYYRQLSNIKEVILLGDIQQSLDLDIQLMENFPIKFDNRVFIKSGSLAELAFNKNLKTELWSKALQPHFIQS